LDEDRSADTGSPDETRDSPVKKVLRLAFLADERFFSRKFAPSGVHLSNFALFLARSLFNNLPFV
jgi:hypothetical protein